MHAIDLRVSGLRDLEHLSGIDLVRVLDDVLVLFVDLLPLLCIAVELLGDAVEVIALLDSVLRLRIDWRFDLRR